MSDTIDQTKLPSLVVSVLGMPKSGKSSLVGRIGGEPYPYYIADNINNNTETIHTSFHKILNFGYYDLYIHDLPSNPKYIKNLYRQLSLSDVFILTIPAKTYELYQEKTRYLAQLAFIAGIDQIIIAVTKMDTIKYSEKEFLIIQKNTNLLLHSIGFKENSIKFCIPIVYHEDKDGNIINPCNELSWFHENTIFSALRQMQPRFFDSRGEFLFSILRTFRMKSFTSEKILGMYGRITSGTISKTDKIVLNSTGIEGKIYMLSDLKRKRETFHAGDMITIAVNRNDLKERKFSGKIFFKNIEPSQLPVCIKFTTKIIILSRNIRIRSGIAPTCHVSQTMFESKWDFIEKTVSKTGEDLVHFPYEIVKGDVAIVACKVITPFIFLVPFKDNRQFGRIFFRDGSTIVAAGVILTVEYTDFNTFKANAKAKNPKKLDATLNFACGSGRLTKSVRY